MGEISMYKITIIYNKMYMESFVKFDLVLFRKAMIQIQKCVS